MFNILNVKDVRENPVLAAEFIKIVPAYELARHLLEAFSSDPEHRIKELLVDINVIRDGILASDRDDLKLVLATYGKVVEFWEPSALHQLAAKGPAFKAALLSNTRIDWYGLNCGVGNERANDILYDTLLADIGDPTNKSLFYAMVCNPRIDRRVIADAMRGVNRFEGLAMETRMLIGSGAIAVKEIPADFWHGKDSPDPHEIYFTQVNASFLPMLRAAKATLDEKKFGSYLTHILWKLPNAELEVRAEDWLTAEEIRSVEEKASVSSDFMDRYNHKRRAALYKVFDYFADWYDRDYGYPQTSGKISTAGVAISAMTSLMRSYAVGPGDVESIVKDMLESPHLIIRAAGYAIIFNNITVQSESTQVKSFFASYPENSLEKWMGITNTKAFWLCVGDEVLGGTIREEMAGSGYDVKIWTAHEDTYQFLFGSESYSEEIATHNKTTRPDLFKSKNVINRVVHKAFSIDQDKIKSAEKPKGLLRKLFD